jgi:hypothetical protein
LGSHAVDYPSIKISEEVKIITSRLDELITVDNCPNFINIDIQGSEYQAILSLGNLLAKIDYIYLEVNNRDVYEGNYKVLNLDEILATFGFNRELTRWVIGKGWGDAIYIKKGLKSDLPKIYVIWKQGKYYFSETIVFAKSKLKKFSFER